PTETIALPLADSFTSLDCASHAAVVEGGFLDSAIPRTQMRFRGDFGYDMNRPDRAEFFYSKSGPGNPGPLAADPKVDYQDLSPYLEFSPNGRFSVFGEVPFRFLNPSINPDERGLSNINAGFKYAILADDCRHLTAQLRWYFPITNSHTGLGYKHEAVEPGLLYSQKVTDRLHVQAEVRDWIPFAGTDYEGNVLRYGIGAGYRVVQTCRYWFGPVAELIGWTALSGKETVVDDFGVVTTQKASGDTIVNASLGV